MADIKNNITETVGSTPLARVNNIEKAHGLQARVLVKLECFNPAGSIKDRAALNMIRDAERSGRLKKGGTIVEPTSGNTGVGLAAMAAAMGYKVVLTMPETMSVERRKLLAAYGAELVLTDGAKGMSGAVEKANELVKSTPGSILAGQFDNTANPEAHELSTGPELVAQTDGRIDYIVAGVGTGGTLSGIAHYLKKHIPNVKAVAVEPTDSPLLSLGKSGPHKLQGIGANFVPGNYDAGAVDEIITVGTDEAFGAARELARSEGYLVGITSGAALFAALKLAQREENKGKTIVAVLPDTGERYLSSGLFD